MNDNELKKLMETMRVPDPRDGAQEKAWERARIAFENREAHTEERTSTQWWKHPIFTFATGASAAAILFVVFGQQPVSQNDFNGYTDSGSDWLKTVNHEQQEVQELQSLFSNQLRAVVKDDEGTRLVLAEEGEEAPVGAQPLLLEITRDGKKTLITTFSGEKVQFDSNDEGSKMEVMMTPEGKVLVVGPNFIWKSDSANQPEGLGLKARALEGGI